MFPGLTTRLSEAVVATAASIQVRSDLVVLTGTTQISNILGQFGGSQGAGILFLLPVDGNVVVDTTGNVAGPGSITMLQNKVTVLVFRKGNQKWYTHALA